MAKTKNLLFVLLATLMMTGSIIVTGCSSAEFWNAADGVKVEKTFKKNVPAIGYELTVKVKVEHNALYITVAGFEVDPIYLREIFSEKDAEKLDCEIVNNELRITAGEKEIFKSKYNR